MTRRRRKTPPNSKNMSSRYGRKRGEKRPSFDMLDPEAKEYQDLLDEASTYDEMIEAHEESGEKITEADYKEAADKFKQLALHGLKWHFNTVKNRFRRYINEGIT